jgi:hypothetical protein
MSLRYPCSTMSKLLIFVSATIVLIFMHGPSFASPTNDVPEPPHETDEWPTPKPSEDLTISTPPRLEGIPEKPDAEYYAYQQQLTFRYGLATDLGKMSFNDNVIGFQYLFPKFLSPKLEAGADLHNDGIGHIHVGMRWIYQERSYFRPSVKVGLDHKASSQEGLATLTHRDNYYLRGTMALEYVVWNPYSLRLEHEFLLGFRDTSMEITLGLSRGW